MRTAIEVAGQDLGAVRIDSGDLPVLARQVRAELDSLGATGTRIILTGDLDEYSIAALGRGPGGRVRGRHLAGHRVRRAHGGAGVQAGGPGRFDRICDSELVPVAKRSVGKPGRGGRKWAVRHRDERRHRADRADQPEPARPRAAGPGTAGAPGDRGRDRGARGDSAARERHRAALAELPPYALQLSRGYPAIPTVFETADRG